MNRLKINQKSVAPGAPCYLIAEVGQAHDGSLGSAHAYIDAIAKTGVDAVKFQTHIAAAESTRHEKFRVNVFPQDATRYDYWKRMEFSAEQWKELANHARDKGLEFLSTPFSVEAVRLLEELDVPAWKVGSGDICNQVLIEEMLKTGKPILLSSGMSSYEELGKTLSLVRASKSNFALFQCTTSYPCNAEDIGYNVITEMKERFRCPVGLSDHSGTIYPSIAAVALGANLIEVHTVFSKDCFGPDTKSSLTIRELKQMVDGVRFVEQGLNNNISKNKAAESRAETKKLFARSAFYSKDTGKGTLLSKSHIAMKKPGGGLSYEEALSLVGKQLKDSRLNDDFIKVEDFE